MRRALSLNAAGLIVAHNHPSGGVAPSASDRRLTRMLQDALTLIDVRMLDHLVVASNEIFSFRATGMALKVNMADQSFAFMGINQKGLIIACSFYC